MKCKNCDALVIQLIAKLKKKLPVTSSACQRKTQAASVTLKGKNMKRSIFREKFTSDITGLNESTNFSPYILTHGLQN
jgi:hypothetical protein